MDKARNKQQIQSFEGRYVGGEQVKLYVLGLLFAVAITAIIALFLCLDWLTIMILLFAFFVFTLMISAIIYKNYC